MQSELTFDFEEKCKILKNIRNDIKKKRILLDESKDYFGLDEMSLLTKVKNTSEIKGYPFKASKKGKSLRGIKMGLKVVPIETKYKKDQHPSNLEYMALKELTDNMVYNRKSPHIVHYLGAQKVSNKCRALKFLNLKRLEVEGCIRSHSTMIISEFVEGGSLDNWIFHTEENDQHISSEQWKYIVFQVIYTIAIMQNDYKMMHNDFHYGNILIDNSIKTYPGSYFVYEINGNTYYLKNTGIIPKLFDFEFCMVYSNKIPGFYANKLVIGNNSFDSKTFRTTIVENNIEESESSESSDSSDSSDSSEECLPINYNEIYDLHYFLCSLLDRYISNDLYEWITSLYPHELIPEESSGSKTSTIDTSTPSSTVTIEEYYSGISNLNSDNASDSDNASNSDNASDSENNSDNASDSDNASNSENNSDNASNSDSDSDSENNSDSDSENNSASESESIYIYEGRIINGVEELFDDLPIPRTILNHSFFESLKLKPQDLDEKVSYYFKSGI